jgi:hypothetical protein
MSELSSVQNLSDPEIDSLGAAAGQRKVIAKQARRYWGKELTFATSHCDEAVESFVALV